MEWTWNWGQKGRTPGQEQGPSHWEASPWRTFWNVTIMATGPDLRHEETEEQDAWVMGTCILVCH